MRAAHLTGERYTLLSPTICMCATSSLSTAGFIAGDVLNNNRAMQRPFPFEPQSGVMYISPSMNALGQAFHFHRPFSHK